jgi:pyruvate dehydrogenase E2 component (dihydrolipoamide acetyltransferase)
MALAVEMPKMSDTMEEGVLVAWLAQEGDRVSAGDVIAQVETDKATMDLEVYDDGVLLKRVVAEGDSVPIGGLIAVLGQEGEDPSALLKEYGGGDGDVEKADATRMRLEGDRSKGGDSTQAAAPEQTSTEEPVSRGDGAAAPARPPADAAADEDRAPAEAQVPPAASDDGSRVKASPLARKMATDSGLDLAGVRGTGPEGRIVKRDVEAALSGKAPAAEPAPAPTREEPRETRRQEAPPVRRAPSPVEQGAHESIPLSQMRKTIARRLAESKFTAPHFYLTADIDMARATAFREQLNQVGEAQQRARVSFNDLVTKACAAALRLHPWVNASYLEKEGEIRKHADVHVAVAVAIDEGLVTPVIRHADRKGLAQIAEETRVFAGKARDRKLEPADWEGSTFTTSNLGMFGIEEFTAIINPPNACILAIGAIRSTPVVRGGEIVPGKMMKVTLSCDHRIVDGATGAAFLQDLRRFLEEPMSMLL